MATETGNLSKVAHLSFLLKQQAVAIYVLISAILVLLVYEFDKPLMSSIAFLLALGVGTYQAVAKEWGITAVSAVVAVVYGGYFVYHF